MAGVTWTRTVARRAPVAPEAFIKSVATIMGSEGRKAVATIQSDIWAIRRFKRPTGRSTKAWGYVSRAESKQVYTLSIFNTATNKRGDIYYRYVHLAGTPRSNLLRYEVNDYATDVLGPKIGQRVAEAYVTLQQSAPVKVTREVR